MDPKHIMANPSASDSSSSVQCPRLDDHQSPAFTCIRTEVANICNADRLDSMLAVRSQKRSVPPSSGFISMHDLLKSQQVFDIKQPQGDEANTLVGESESIHDKPCEDWSEGDSFLANYDTDMSLSNEEPKQSDTSDVKPILPLENPQQSTHLLLEDISMSEWETIMDVPAVSSSKIASSQWPHMGVPEAISDVFGFRTASNKPIDVTEEMKKRGAKLLADIKVPEQLIDQSDAEFLQEIDLTEWEEMDIPENRTAINKPIEVAQEMGMKADKLIADVEADTKYVRNLKSSNTFASSEAAQNLLSASKQRKRVSTVGECQDQDTATPAKLRFAPTSTATSTPLSNRNINLFEEYRGGDDVSMSLIFND